MNRSTTRPGAATVLACLLLVTACAGGAPRAPQVAEAPTTIEQQLDFGVDMARRGLWSEALFRFRQAERLRPGDPRILNNVAVAYEALGQFENALDYYQQAIKANPGDRDLKRNYSRFVEFYRAFKPDDQADASVDEAGAGG